MPDAPFLPDDRGPRRHSSEAGLTQRVEVQSWLWRYRHVRGRLTQSFRCRRVEPSGFIVPYQLTRARRFGRPAWFVPHDLV
jgi:hypothetical protein